MAAAVAVVVIAVDVVADATSPKKISNRQRSFTKAPWESEVGYCRAIKAGNQIFITGTAPVDQNGAVFASGDAYEQAKRCFTIIQETLKSMDTPMESIVRTRMFVTDISRWREFGRAHKEFFAEFPPATTMVEVKSLIDPKMLIEVEADAVIDPLP